MHNVKHRPQRRLAVVLAIATVITAAVTVAAQAAERAERKTIEVGNIASITGLGGVFSGFNAGVKAFFSAANASGGIAGYTVNLTALDDGGDPGKNTTAARQLVDQKKVIAIVGESSCADAASVKYLQGKNIPVVGGWICSPTWLSAKNMFLSLAGPNKPYCPIWSSDQAKARGIKKIYFIAQDFPQAVDDAVCRSSAAKSVGLTMVGDIGKASVNAVDYRPVVQDALDAGADAIYFSTGTDGQLKGIVAGEQLGFKGSYITTQFGSSLMNGLASAGLTEKVSGRVFSAAFSLLTDDPPSYSPELRRAKAGIAKYQPNFKDDVTALSGWAAGKLFADALTAAGPDPKKIIAWISKQKRYTFGGLQGPMDYTKGSRPNQCVTAIQWKAGKIVRDIKAAAAPGFNCGPLISFDGKKTLAPRP